MKENICLGLPYSSRGLVHYHGGEHDGTQADVVQKKFRILYPDPPSTGRESL